ncbi:DUF4249 domain-containing protein [Runella salmonicolor]|uniref:DUF4249 domain-containing protein n=1 Tax=Runella salmonicolor TaxID=2950278 RepID=A0ABT1FUI9_9BACT|nr:DUF4249 domain-containing protein [Runella salmonicolor]MCP1385434.1 DUF4249 domain-containing protein [Runella salmonicolor]
MRIIRNRYNKFILASVLSVLFVSCIREIDLALRVEKPVLVVDGMITNEAPPYNVKLTYTGVYEASNRINENQAVSGARVSITDDQGLKTQLEQVLEEPGKYQTNDPQYWGRVGRSYTLTVELPNGEVYESSPEKLMAVPEIDKLYSEFTENGSGDQRVGYNVFLDAKDPKDAPNYYRWQAIGYRMRLATGVLNPFSGAMENKQCWQSFKKETIDIETDVDFDGNTIQKRLMLYSPAYSNGQYLIEVTQMSLSREVYQFWRRMNEQLTRTGSIFDPLPSPVEGNISLKTNPNKLALGYFGASAVSKKRLIIFETDEAKRQRIEVSSQPFVPTGGCTNLFPGTTPFKPSGW